MKNAPIYVIWGCHSGKYDARVLWGVKPCSIQCKTQHIKRNMLPASPVLKCTHIFAQHYSHIKQINTALHFQKSVSSLTHYGWNFITYMH